MITIAHSKVGYGSRAGAILGEPGISRVQLSEPSLATIWTPKKGKLTNFGATGSVSKTNRMPGFTYTTDGYHSGGTIHCVKFLHQTMIFTLEVVFKLANIVDDYFTFCASNGQSAYEGFFLGWSRVALPPYAKNLSARFFIYNGLGSANIPLILDGFDNSIPDTKPHHVVLTGDGDNVYYYVDGLLKDTAAKVNVLGNGTCHKPLHLGTTPLVDSETHFLEGEFRFMDITVNHSSSQRVQSLYHKAQKNLLLMEA